MFTQKIFPTRFTDIFGQLEKLIAFEKIALLFSFFENTRHMGKETNSLTLTDVLGPLAQSAERGADNAKVVSSTLTRTSKH